jgi:hypothetical protein
MFLIFRLRFSVGQLDTGGGVDAVERVPGPATVPGLGLLHAAAHVVESGQGDVARHEGTT